MRKTNVLLRLRGQRGDADPLLTIGAMVATLIVGTAIVGSVMALMNIGGKFTADQINATNVSSARDAFALDAQNATAVSAVLNSSVRFTQNPFGSAITSDRGTNGKTCRVSDWSSVKEADGSYTLVDTVWQTAWNAIAKTCAATSGSGSRALSVTGFPAAPTLTYANAAGASITFNAAGDGSTPARLAGSYYTAEEWGSWIPKTVILTGQMGSKTSGTKPSTLIGVTNLKEVHSALAPMGNEPKPTREVFDPAPPTIVSVVPSKTIGAVFGGQREGISVTWTASQCGPYTVKYDVTYTPSTPGVSTQTYTVTSYDLKFTADLDHVPNGSHGTVRVKATCPPSVSSKPATSATPYDHPLPAPKITGASAVNPTTQQVRWSNEALSSLPVQYFIYARHAGQSGWPYGSWWMGGYAFNWGWTPGYTFGTSQYTMIARVAGGAQSGYSNVANVVQGWDGYVPRTTVWSANFGGAVYDNAVAWNTAACPAGTNPQYNPVVSGSGYGWQGSLSARVSVRYSTTYSAYVQTRCVSPFETSPAVDSRPTTWRTNNPPPPIPSAPGVSGRYNRGPGGGGQSTWSVSGVSYANQYEGGTNVIGVFGQTGYSSAYVGSSGTYAGSYVCGMGATIQSGGARARAGGASGWSGYQYATLTPGGAGIGCS